MYCSNAVYYSGWNIIVVYEDLTLPNTQLNIYNGFRYVGNENFFSYNFLVDGLNIIDTANAKMSTISWNGSPNQYFGESILLNNNTLSNAQNPADNAFNSTNNFTGSSTNWNQDIDLFDISPFIAVGDTSVQITVNSIALRFLQTLVTSIRSELPDATAKISSVIGQETCGNRDLVVTCTISNSNSNATIPSIPVAFYANNTLLTVENTDLPIAVGDSSTFSVPVTIPNNIPDTFNLRIVADNNGTNFSSVAESNENNNEAAQVITLLANTVIPTFTIQNSFCQGDAVPNLPLISLNNISGTWSPSVISNQNSGSYVFTPNVTQCISNFTLDVTVQTLPTITETVFICEDENGDAVFPAVLSTELGGGNYTFAWFQNSVPILNTQSSLLVFEAGNYEVIATPIVSGCNTLFNFQVVALQPIVVDVVAPQTDFASNQTIVVNASGGSGVYVYSFDGLTFQNNSVFTVQDGGTISIIVKDVNGCYTYSENVAVWNYPRFFTPNNDGFNDTWGIVSQKPIATEIFDQYGKLVKKLTKNERWDGLLNSQMLPATDYWFVIYYDSNKSFRSHFSLKR